MIDADRQYLHRLIQARLIQGPVLELGHWMRGSKLIFNVLERSFDPIRIFDTHIRYAYSITRIAHGHQMHCNGFGN